MNKSGAFIYSILIFPLVWCCNIWLTIPETVDEMVKEYKRLVDGGSIFIGGENE